MAGDGASEIMREVTAAISYRTRMNLNISTQIAAGPHPLPEQRLADLRMLQRVIAGEISELCVVHRGLRVGDLSFMEKMRPGRLGDLLNGTTDWLNRPHVPVGRLNMVALSRAINVAFGMPLASSSTGAVMAASDAPPSARGQAAAVAAAREDLARLQI